MYVGGKIKSGGSSSSSQSLKEKERDIKIAVDLENFELTVVGHPSLFPLFFSWLILKMMNQNNQCDDQTNKSSTSNIDH